MAIGDRLTDLSATQYRTARVRMEDGRVARVRVPKNATPEQAVQIARQVVPKAKPQRRTKEQILQDRVARHPIAGPFTTFIGNAADMLTFGAGDEIRAGLDSINPFNSGSVWRGGSMDQNLRAARRQDRVNKEQNPKSAFGGAMAGAVAPVILTGGGSLAATAPKVAGARGLLAAAKPTAAAMAQGGAYAFNSGEGDIGDRLAMVPEGMAWAAGGDIVGRGLGQLVSRAVGGRQLSAAQKALVDEDVLLTPGMRGGPVKRLIEDKVMGTIPFLDEVPAQARDRSFASLRRATANRVLGPLGKTVDDVAELAGDTDVANVFAGNLNKTVYSAYDDALSGLALNADDALNKSLDDVLQTSALSMTDDQLKVVERNIGQVREKLAKGTLTGKALRETMRGIRERASKLARTEQGDALWSLNGVLEDALDAQNGATASEAYKSARQAVSLLKRFENAASRPGVVEGRFNPSHLKQAAQKRGFGTTDANVADGTAPLMDLANNAAEVMRIQTANSGTPGRLLTTGGLLGAPAMLGAADPVMGGLLASQTLGYIPGIDRILQNMAVNRPAWAQGAADVIRNNNRALGLLGVGGALSLSQ